MNKLFSAFRRNFIIYVEGLFFLILLGLNFFVGYNLYRNVILDIRPEALDMGEVTYIKIISLNTTGLNNFGEDQKERKFFIEEIDESYTRRWEKFKNSIDPFLR